MDNPDTSSLMVHWIAGSSGTACDFVAHLVQQRADGGEWAAAAGCGASTIACESSSACVATGLPSNTLLQFRVRADLSPPCPTSEWALAASLGQTLPLPAVAPMTLVGATPAATDTSLTFEWIPRLANDCISIGFLVQRTWEGNTQWVSASDCADVRRAGSAKLSCQLTGLACDTEYRMRVQEVCENDATNSPFSLVMGPYSTQDAPGCVVIARAPKDVSAEQNAKDGNTSVKVSWELSGQGDCVFKAWRVQHSLSWVETWVETAGCGELTSQDVSSCWTTGLRSNTEYEFRVREECEDPSANSEWSVSEERLVTLPVMAVAPLNVVASQATKSSATVFWDVPSFGDCSFERYLVHWREAADAGVWITADGCFGLSGACDPQCVATSLPTYTPVLFRTAVVCSNTATNSIWSENSAEIQTLPEPAVEPVGLKVEYFTSTTALLVWQAAGLQQCEFQKWQVELKGIGGVWNVKESCQHTGFNNPACALEGLACDNKYEARVAVACGDTAANSGYSEAADFKTDKGSVCLQRATMPTGVTAREPSTTTLKVIWEAGKQSPDCVFKEWAVQLKEECDGCATALAAAATPEGCGNLAEYEANYCFARGLSDNVEYRVYVQEVCTEDIVSSTVAMSDDTVSTLEVPAPYVLMRDPPNGANLSSRPERVMLIFSNPVKIGYAGGTLRICSMGEGDAGCTTACEYVRVDDASSFSLWTERVAVWSVNVSLWRHGCQYGLYVAAGVFVTALEPVKNAPAVDWRFSYVADLPRMQLASGRSYKNATSLQVTVRWDTEVRFQCRALRWPLEEGAADSTSEELLATPNADAVAVLTGMRPGSTYSVQCHAWRVDDPVVRSPWYFAAKLSTNEDVNANLKKPIVKVLPECPGMQRQAFPYQEFPLMSTFTTELSDLTVVVTSDTFKQACEWDYDDASWRVTVQFETESTWANLSVTWSGGHQSGDSRLVTLPVGRATTLMVAYITVWAADGCTSRNFTLTVMCVRVEQLAVTAVRIFTPAGALRSSGNSGREAFANTTFEAEDGDFLEVDVRCSWVNAVLQRLVVTIGPFKQNTTLLPSASSAAEQTLEVAKMSGVGRALNLEVHLYGDSIGVPTPRVNFAPVEICSISTVGFLGCARRRGRQRLLSSSQGIDFNASVSTVGSTTIYVEAFPGRGFGSYDVLDSSALPDDLLQIKVIGGDGTNSSVCGTSERVSSTQMWCTIEPTQPPPLQLLIYAPSSRGNELVSGAIELPYQRPSIFVVTPTVLPLDEEVRIYLWGRGLPSFAAQGARLELWRASLGAAGAGESADALGAIVACNNFTLMNDTVATCVTRRGMELGSLACLQPALVVVWPSGGTMALAGLDGAVSFQAPQLLHVLAPVGPQGMPVEVGQDLLYTLDGTGLGNEANGELQVRIGDRLCQIESRTPTRIFCAVTGPLLDDLAHLYPDGDATNGDDDGAVNTGHAAASGVVNITVSVLVSVVFGAAADDALTCTRAAAAWKLSVELLRCGPGQHRASAGNDECVDCLPGLYQHHFSPTLNCSRCGVGRFSVAGQAECAACPAGNATQLLGSTACAPCPAGEFEANNSCYACSSGTHTPVEGSSACTLCEGGRYTEASSAILCSACPAGRYAEDNICQVCLEGKYASASGVTACTDCRRGYFTREDGATECKDCIFLKLGLAAAGHDTKCSLEDTIISPYFVLLLLGCALCFTAVSLCFNTLWRTIPLVDVRRHGDHVILETRGPHQLATWTKAGILKVVIAGTSGTLDGEYYARIQTSERLELVDINGFPITNAVVEVSIGRLGLKFPEEFVWSHSGFNIPRLLWIGVLSCGAALTASAIDLRVFFVELSLSVVISGIVNLLRRYVWYPTSPIIQRIKHHREILHAANPTPQPSNRGPHRAVTARQLEDLFEFFHSYIGDRNMYYMADNILKPITRKLKLSYAELAGPHEVEWFVSHYWGNSFKEFVRSVCAHAQSCPPPVDPDPGAEQASEGSRGRGGLYSEQTTGTTFRKTAAWGQIPYWICTLSNNQWHVAEELGGGSWMESSFYKALQHESCRGTLMVLDPLCLPLTRSWCLFEVLQTNLLQRERQGFDFLFGTSAGVINIGLTSTDMVLKIVRKVKDLDLRTASASVPDDKQMIDALIVEEGGFDAMNAFVRSNISEVLKHAKRHLEQEFEQLDESLQAAIRSTELVTRSIELFTVPSSASEEPARSLSSDHHPPLVVEREMTDSYTLEAMLEEGELMQPVRSEDETFTRRTWGPLAPPATPPSLSTATSRLSAVYTL